jgi:hypothetical protein
MSTLSAAWWHDTHLTLRSAAKRRVSKDEVVLWKRL